MKPKEIVELEKELGFELTEINKEEAFSNSPQKTYMINKKSVVTHLFLDSCQIESVESLKYFTDLSFLSLGVNQITDLSFLKNLTKLTWLNLEANQIKDISILSNLKNIEILDLQKNQIDLLSPLKNLSKLESLNISHNYIEDISPISGLVNLSSLKVNNNDINKIYYKNIAKLSSLKSILLYGNPIDNISKEIYNDAGFSNSFSTSFYKGNCLKDLKNYFNAQIEGEVINTTSKVIWFGNGEAGKTTLCHQLRNNSFDKKIGDNRTHGILVNNWEIDLDDLPTTFYNKVLESCNKNPSVLFPTKITLKLWDFGGQEYYHATHRLFLSENSLFLLVWDKDTNYQDDEKGIYPLEYWRNNINNYCDKNITLEIQNKEKGEATTNHENLKYKVCFHTKNETDITKYNLDIEDLKKGIFQQLHKLEYLGKTFPKVYDDIRIALENEEKPFLTFLEYKILCQENDFTDKKIMQNDSQIETLTNLLHETSSILCYRFHNKFGNIEGLNNYVFTKPTWVTDGIYDILDEKLQGVGEFDIKHIKESLSKSKSIISYQIWVDLMKTFELVFENKSKNNFVAPQYLPQECTEIRALNWALKSNPQLAFKFYFPTYLPRSLFLRFIAYYGTNNIDNLYWKNGLVFSLNEKTVYATYNYQEKTISISVQEQDKTTIQEIYNWFKDKFPKNTEVSVGKEFEKLESLQNPKYQSVYQHDFWFVFEKSDLQQNKTMAEKKKKINIFVSYSSKDRKLRNVKKINLHFKFVFLFYEKL